MIALQSTPVYNDESVSPAIPMRWLATECPNNFRLLREDFIVTGQAGDGGSPEYTELTLSSAYTGQVGNSIAIISSHNDAVYVGTVLSIASPATTIVVDVPWDAAFDIEYLNDNTLHAGYYFEGRLTVNGAVQALTIIASPDTYGFADLDVSGILRIMAQVGKTGDYSTTLMTEPLKSGTFTLEYRECWYGSEGAWFDEGNTWYYAEAIRSIEQGSNLHEFTPNAAGDAPFFNAFAQPVFFAGLPFDITFLCPPLPTGSPSAQLQVVIKRYNAANTLLGTSTTVVDPTGLEGRAVSLNINPAIIEATAAYLTAEINIV